jgi:hypothetical protein
MGLNFIGEKGVYLPRRNAIKIIAVDGHRVIDCYAKPSALAVLGDWDRDDAGGLLRTFERHRDAIEIAAMIKYRQARYPVLEIQIEAVDLRTLLPAAEAAA